MLDLGTLVGKIELETKEAISGLQGIKNNSEESSGGILNLSSNIKKFVAGAATIATVAIAIKEVAEAISNCVKKALDLDKSLNSLQASTGATDEEMIGLENSLKNIYANNYGEDFQDIASALSEVKTQTGLVGEELEQTTENALAMRDTFDMDVKESIRSVDMMMKQFGLTSDEAYNLIAQGAQKGLNKNDNLLDSVNEYSVHFSQLGFSAEEMFNMFSNGAENGVFDIDKLGDAVKEFGIRAKDGSKTTTEAFEILNLNADEMQQKFAQGGDVANEAFKEVITALNNCSNEVDRNNVGVNLFGTMWEDLGVDAINALTNTNGAISTTADNLESIKEIKYDDFGSAMEGIGRQLEVGIMLPIGEKILPILNDFANWINEKMPDIKSIIKETFDKASKAVGFLIDNFNIILPIISGVVAGFASFSIINTISSLFTTFKTILTGVSTAQGVLNAVMSANPFGAIAAAIGILIGVGTALYMNWDTVKQKCQELFTKLTEIWENIKISISSKIEELKQAIKNKVEEFKKAGEEVFTNLWNGIKETWESIVNWLKEAVTGIVDTVKSICITIYEAGKEVFTNLWNGCKNMWLSILNWLIEIMTEIIDTVKSIGTKIYNAGKEVFQKLWEGYKNIWKSIYNWIKDIINTIVDTIKSIKDKMYNAGKEIFTSMWDGIKNIWENISNWVSDKISWLIDKVSFWKSESSKLDSSSVDGSHRIGLRSVPFDDYKAILHKGEMVLTQPEADRYRQGNTDINNQNSPTIIQNFYNVKEEKTAFQVKREVKKIIKNFKITSA